MGVSFLARRKMRKSCQNYFDRLRRKTRDIDAGIERLAEIWKMPHLLVGGYAKRTAEIDAYLEEMSTTIQSTGVAVEKLNSELKPFVDKTDEDLNEAQMMYENLKAQCDSLDIVLAEYGYQYEDSNDVQENNSRSSSQNCTTDNVTIKEELSMKEEMPDVEVEFTPDLTWKCKAKSRDSDNFNGNQKNPIKGIATPVIKSLESVLQSQILKREDL